MLHSKVFRIGNAVIYKNEIKMVTAEDLQNIESPGYRPLLINTQRMYMLGFMDENYETWQHEILDFNLVMVDDSYYQYVEDTNTKIGRPMMYAHDLQNRCYSMTGAELIMNS